MIFEARKEDRSTVRSVAWVREELDLLESLRFKLHSRNQTKYDRSFVGRLQESYIVQVSCGASTRIHVILYISIAFMGDKRIQKPPAMSITKPKLSIENVQGRI